MKHEVNGKFVEVVTASDGTVDAAALHRATGIPNERPLIVQMPDGSKRIISANESIPAGSGQTFVDAPLHMRGMRA